MTTEAQLQAAVELLRQPIHGADDQGVFFDLSGIHMTDNSGGRPIEYFDDVTAVHNFLVWLDLRRLALAKDIEKAEQEHEAARQRAVRRSSMKVVKGGKRAK